jgi:hypothetical protein
MYHLYGSKTGAPKKLAATFDSEEQLLAYVRWATLSERDGVHQFEKGSALASCHQFDYSREPLTDRGRCGGRPQSVAEYVVSRRSTHN